MVSKNVPGSDVYIHCWKETYTDSPFPERVHWAVFVGETLEEIELETSGVYKGVHDTLEEAIDSAQQICSWLIE
jgi:hypothetical protein